MLDSLRDLGTFPRQKDPRFSTTFAYARSASLSYISAWQPYTLTFVGTWRRAASLAAGEGRLFLECRRHPSILRLERERR